jgi:hypothetical protein
MMFGIGQLFKFDDGLDAEAGERVRPIECPVSATPLWRDVDDWHHKALLLGEILKTVENVRDTSQLGIRAPRLDVQARR